MKKDIEEDPLLARNALLAVFQNISTWISDSQTRDGALAFGMRDIATRARSLDQEIGQQIYEDARSAVAKYTLVGTLRQIDHEFGWNEPARPSQAVVGGDVKAKRAKTDVVLLTVIPVEFDAALRAFGIEPEKAKRQIEIHGLKYYAAEIPAQDRKGGSGSLRLLIAMISEPRNIPCVNVCRDVLEHISTDAVILVGIAGGNRRKSVKLGDVVAVEAVVDIEGGRSEIVPKIGLRFRNRGYFRDLIFSNISRWVFGDNAETRVSAVLATIFGERREVAPRIKIMNLDSPMREYVQQFRPDGEGVKDRIEKVLTRYPRTELPRDLDKYSMSYHPGLIICGEKVLADGSIPEIARRHHGNIVAVDMESSGFAAACSHCGKPWAVFRGVSDYADPRKGDRWHIPASVAAAVSAREFLASGYATPNERDQVW